MKYIDEFRNGTIAAGISKKNCFSCGRTRQNYHHGGMWQSYHVDIPVWTKKSASAKSEITLRARVSRMCYLYKLYRHCHSMVQKTGSCLVSEKEVIITTFGDMMKVPGSSSSLEKERAKGASVAVVYSTLDALRLAEKHPDKQIVFLAIGFETTAPTIAASVIEAERRGLKNYFLLTAHKVMPPVMKALLKDKELNLDGFLCPAHVSAIIGSRSYEFIARDFHISCVIAGFEPLDILQGIYMLLEQIVRKDASVKIQYSRVAKEEGNPTALSLLDKVFEPCDAEWRGLGLIPKSGLKLRGVYATYDALSVFRISDFGFRINSEIRNPKSAFNGCICGDILRGIKMPFECKLFKKVCNPEHPVGACMVSNEGTCAAWYKYGET